MLFGKKCKLSTVLVRTMRHGIRRTLWWWPDISSTTRAEDCCRRDRSGTPLTGPIVGLGFPHRIYAALACGSHGGQPVLQREQGNRGADQGGKPFPAAPVAVTATPGCSALQVFFWPNAVMLIL